MKVYPKSIMMAPMLVSKDSLNKVGYALQRFRNEFGIEKLSFCIPDRNNQFCCETNELLLVLFDHIEGVHPQVALKVNSTVKKDEKDIENFLAHWGWIYA